MSSRRDPAITRRIMSSIKGKGTKAELLLGKAMWGFGLRYRKQYPILGHPDFVFVSARVAVFCDGDFWHGRGFEHMDLTKRFPTNYAYWSSKIKGNKVRDLKVNAGLKKSGWIVLRFWDSEVQKNPNRLARKVFQKVNRGCGKYAVSGRAEN